MGWRAPASTVSLHAVFKEKYKMEKSKEKEVVMNSYYSSEENYRHTHQDKSPYCYWRNLQVKGNAPNCVQL